MNRQNIRSSMDGAATYPIQEFPPVAPAVELYPVHEVAPRVVEVQSYEPYSISAALQAMFAEAEQAGDGREYWSQAYEAREYPKDTEAFRDFMKEVYQELKTSDAVQALRRSAPEQISEHLVEAVFRAYERAVATAVERMKPELSADQLAQVKNSARNSLDWSYRHLLMERLTQGNTEARYTPEDFFLILNPKARKVQYMERQEILKSLRNSASLMSKEQLQREVRLAHEFAHEDAHGDTIIDTDLAPFEI